MRDILINKIEPVEPICKGSEGKGRFVGFELRVEHIEGKSHSIIENKEQRDLLVDAMRRFVLMDPCLPKLSNPGSVVVDLDNTFERPDGELVVDAIRGGVIAYTVAPCEVKNFEKWLLQTNERLKQVFVGAGIRAYVSIDEPVSSTPNPNLSAKVQPSNRDSDSFCERALRAIQGRDADTIEMLRGEVLPEHVPVLVETWSAALPWDVKEGYTHLLMDQVDEMLKPILEDALNSPNPDMQATGICGLKAIVDGWTFRQCNELFAKDWDEIKAVIAEYRDKTRYA